MIYQQKYEHERVGSTRTGERAYKADVSDSGWEIHFSVSVGADSGTQMRTMATFCNSVSVAILESNDFL